MDKTHAEGLVSLEPWVLRALLKIAGHDHAEDQSHSDLVSKFHHCVHEHAAAGGGSTTVDELGVIATESQPISGGKHLAESARGAQVEAQVPPLQDPAEAVEATVAPRQSPSGAHVGGATEPVRPATSHVGISDSTFSTLRLTSATGIITTLLSSDDPITAGRDSIGLPDNAELHRRHLQIGWHAHGWGTRKFSGAKNPVYICTPKGDCFKAESDPAWSVIGHGDMIFLSNKNKSGFSLKVSATEETTGSQATADDVVPAAAGVAGAAPLQPNSSGPAEVHRSSTSRRRAVVRCAAAGDWSYQIDTEHTIIGRAAKNSGGGSATGTDCAPPSGVVDKTMSRRHAQIRRGDDGCFQLTCLGANHVLVDGQLLKAGEPPLELSHGNRLVVGSSVLLFQAIAAVPDLGADRQRQGANKVERWLQDT